MISQLTVFLENKKGHLASACRTISDAGINMQALFLADTQDFGVARIFCDTPEIALKTLEDAGFRAALTPVIALRVANEPGYFATLLEYCDDHDMNVEYAYCFSVNDTAINVLKIKDDAAQDVLSQGGFELVSAEEIYTLS